jgi:hypothetical protein
MNNQSAFASQQFTDAVNSGAIHRFTIEQPKESLTFSYKKSSSRLSQLEINKTVKINVILFVFGFILQMSSTHAGTNYLDNYTESIRLFGVAGEGQQIDHDLNKRIKAPYYFMDGHKAYSTPGYDYDIDDKRNGDFSIRYRPDIKKQYTKFGFMTNLWSRYPDLGVDDRLLFEVKTVGTTEVHDTWNVVFFDSEGRTASAELMGMTTHEQWKTVVFPLSDLKLSKNFSVNAIRSCEFETNEFTKGTVIKFDFIRFEKENGQIIGVTDKTIDRILIEQKATHALRINKAFEAASVKAHKPIISAFAMLYLNQNLDRANEIIRDDCHKMADEGLWSLLTTPMYCRLYFLFSNRCGTYPGRLEPETEKLLLETIWKRTVHKNDIHWARTSTWYMDGSENHDLNAKACNLVSSRIFMNEPEYKDRIYPDYGFGGGYHYGRAGYYGKGVDAEKREGGGRANLKDGKKYKAADHYHAWVRYMKEYFRERSKYGFFLENSSCIYAKHTINMVDLAYAYSGDVELHGIIDNFMTLYWADYVQTAIGGISGGPKTRHHKKVGGYDANTGMLISLLGGPADAGIWNYWSNVNGYHIPKVVQMMALNRDAMGSFVYQSRGIGEAEPAQPRPLGTERTLIVNPESKFLKYSYVTPSYTLNTQMDHPWALHSHLSKAGRWHGMTVAQDVKARIVPVLLPTEPHFRGKLEKFTMEGMYKTFQDKNTLIVQRSRSFSEVNPDWYPIYKQRTDQGVYIGKAWDEQSEEDGWIFFRKGKTYAGIRVVLWDKAFEDQKSNKNRSGNQKHFHGPNDSPTVKLLEKPFSYSDDRDFIILNDRFSPIIIQAGDANEYGDYESFKQRVIQAKISLHKTVVPSFNILIFNQPRDGGLEMVFNAANNEIPLLNGKYINYEHPKTFDSPYLNSQYKSGKIEINFKREEVMIDFSI